MSRVLLVSPQFHGYWHSIAGAIARRGHDVSAFCYDSFTPVGKVARKAALELPRRLGVPTEGLEVHQLTRRAVRAVREVSPDVVVVVKGDLFGPDFLEAIGPRRSVLWLYDELRRTRHTPESLRAYDAIASYSPLDVAQLSAAGHLTAFLPNAFDPSLTPAPRPGGELVFIGARYPKRVELLTALAAAGVPVRAYGRDWSTHPVDRLRSLQWARPGLPAGRDVALRDGYALMAGAPATLNSHSDQDGFTMRTFEACGVGAVQLIDRRDLQDLYEDGREVLCFDDADELIDLAMRCFRDPGWAETIRVRARERTLAEHTFDHRMRVLERLWH
ncbi:MAG: glycosyltransferase [Propionibacteriaceae bacterium]|nr:glycosyltransferase [Propionibacteriaceae bacterium]